MLAVYSMAAEALLKAADALLVSADPVVCPRTIATIAEMREAVQDEFNLDLPMRSRGGKRTEAEMKLQKQVQYQRKCRKTAEASLQKLRGDKVGGSVRREVFVRVGLSDPSLNGRQLRAVLSTDIGQACISHVYIGKVRDAFAELLKSMVRE